MLRGYFSGDKLRTSLCGKVGLHLLCAIIFINGSKLFHCQVNVTTTSGFPKNVQDPQYVFRKPCRPSQGVKSLFQQATPLSRISHFFMSDPTHSRGTPVWGGRLLTTSGSGLNVTFLVYSVKSGVLCQCHSYNFEKSINLHGRFQSICFSLYFIKSDDMIG